MLSIVTGTLNRRHLLPGLIRNTVDTSDKLELVLVDGGSTDGTIEYLRDINNPKIKVIEIEHRSKYAHYMGEGIKNASYEYVCQWNDDALLLGSWGRVIDIIKEPYDVFIFRWRYQECEVKIDRESLLSKKDGWVLYCDANNTCLNYGVYRKQIFREIGMYSSVFEYYHADKDMSERARIFGYKIRPCPEISAISLYEQKRAILLSIENDYQKGSNNIISFYSKKNLPDTVEFLE